MPAGPTGRGPGRRHVRYADRTRGRRIRSQQPDDVLAGQRDWRQGPGNLPRQAVSAGHWRAPPAGFEPGRLTKTERLRESLLTAATGRRAVEHAPQSGSIG